LLKGLDERAASIYAPIQDQLANVEDRLRGLSDTDAPYLDKLLDYVLVNGGKRIRPAITLLAADFYPHQPENPITMASAVELLHVAALIHDDTVDNSDLRRGKATVGNRWGQHVAVLFGDYVFATSATFVCDTGNIGVIRRFSETIMDLASGELIEYFSAFDAEQARRLYDERIYRKTASLFRTAAETGAILGDAPDPQIQALRTYGYNIGMAFQIVDDLLDVQGDAAELGKPVGNDLLQGVLTLPSIMLMERYPNDNPIEKLFKDPGQDGQLQRALEMINDSTIIDDCNTVIRKYCGTASGSLDILPDCPARNSLLDLSGYISDRNH
jgi:octaprenyl-diphosphate synthase